jgi:hypothetical protein
MALRFLISDDEALFLKTRSRNSDLLKSGLKLYDDQERLIKNNYVSGR